MADNKNGSQKATYESAARMVQMMIDLRQSPFGLTYEQIEDQLGLTRRTLQRYLEAIREKVFLPDGDTPIEVVDHGENRLVRLRTENDPPESSAFRLYSFLLSLKLGHLVEGTIVGDMNQDLWESIRKDLAEKKTKDLDHIERKLFSLASMPRDYSRHDDLINDLFTALVKQHRQCIEYGGVLGEKRTHEFDAYSLVEHRGGLYLLGKSHTRKKIIWLAVERILGTETVKNEAGKPLRFAYPTDFNPADYTNGMFGVFDGEKVCVRLALANEKTEAFLRARRIHDTQRFYEGPDGRTHLEMTVRGTTELMNWILSTSPWVEVLEPAELREEVAARLRESAAVYSSARPPARAESTTAADSAPQRELPLTRSSRSS